MKIKVEVDVSDIIQSMGDEDVLQEEVKRQIVSKIATALWKNVSINKLQMAAEEEYSKKIRGHIDGLIDHSKWFTENITAAAINKQLIPMMKDSIIKGVVSSLKSDPSFIRLVAKEAFNDTTTSSPVPAG